MATPTVRRLTEFVPLTKSAVPRAVHGALLRPGLLHAVVVTSSSGSSRRRGTATSSIENHRARSRPAMALPIRRNGCRSSGWRRGRRSTTRWCGSAIDRCRRASCWSARRRAANTPVPAKSRSRAGSPSMRARSIEALPDHEVDLLDVSDLADEPLKVIYPCKACVSTAQPLCHWPCSCYPNHALGQAGDWMNELYPRWAAAHGVFVITPVNWYHVPASFKLMMDRLVCADGGNADPTTTKGKNPELAKELELAGWPFPKHLGRPRLRGADARRRGGTGDAAPLTGRLADRSRAWCRPVRWPRSIPGSAGTSPTPPAMTRSTSDDRALHAGRAGGAQPVESDPPAARRQLRAAQRRAAPAEAEVTGV